MVSNKNIVIKILDDKYEFQTFAHKETLIIIKEHGRYQSEFSSEAIKSLVEFCYEKITENIMLREEITELKEISNI